MFEKPFEKRKISPETTKRINIERGMLGEYYGNPRAKVYEIATIAAVAKKISPEAAKELI